MKILFLLFLTSACFAQKKDSVLHVPLSPGEQLTIKEHDEVVKQTLPIVRFYFKHDSINQRFIKNTISPYLHPGDTVENWIINEKEIQVRLKRRKK